MPLVKTSDTLARSAYRVAEANFGGTIGTQAAVQTVRELDQLAGDDIRAGRSFPESALTDAAIQVIPPKRLQANIGGLEIAGFAPFLYRHDIAAGEDWEARLGGLIAESDTVVFVVLPEAPNHKLGRGLLYVCHSTELRLDWTASVRHRNWRHVGWARDCASFV